MIRLVAIIVFMVPILFPAGGDAAERYGDTVSRVSFDLPSDRWTTAPGLGGEIAALHAPDGAVIRLFWHEGKSKGRVGPPPPGVASFLQPVDGGVVEVRCQSPPQSFLEVFFECRAFAKGIRRDAGRMDAGALSDAVRAALQEGRYALLDGRAGCAATSERIRQVLREARRFGDASAARQLDSLAAQFEGKVRRGTDRDEERRRDPFFSRLIATRLLLEQGEGRRAGAMLPKEDGASRLASALRMWASRLGGDLRAVRSIAERFDGEFCGESGALAAHELGLALRDEEPDRAQALFETAIAADRSFTPAYVSLCRLLLDRGEEAGAVSARLRSLLARAPATTEIQRLRRDLEATEKGMRE